MKKRISANIEFAKRRLLKPGKQAIRRQASYWASAKNAAEERRGFLSVFTWCARRSLDNVGVSRRTAEGRDKRFKIMGLLREHLKKGHFDREPQNVFEEGVRFQIDREVEGILGKRNGQRFISSFRKTYGKVGEEAKKMYLKRLEKN